MLVNAAGQVAFPLLLYLHKLLTLLTVNSQRRYAPLTALAATRIRMTHSFILNYFQ